MSKRHSDLIPNHRGQEGSVEEVDQDIWFTEAYWTLLFGDAWTQDDNTLVCDGTVNGTIHRTNFWTIGTTYIITISCIASSGHLAPPHDNVVLADLINSSGTYSYTYTPTATGMRIVGSTFVGSITALSIREALVNDTQEILNVSANSGSIINKYTGDTIGALVPELTIVATTIHKDGEINAMLFNQATSKITCGDYWDGTGDCTISIWLKPYYNFAHAYGFILNNAKLVVYYAVGTENVWIYSDGVGAWYTPADSAPFNIWTNVVIVREASGNSNFYVNGEVTLPYDQDTGTPTAGTTNLYIGNEHDSSHPFNGLLGNINIVDGLLTATEINQIYTSGKHKFGL